ncbi:MAG: tetratricopeptide repeat protein [Acidobacteria bacterium]|nr:tetratricopeptide repeat protein [Acidobacteriota bacterium]
MTAKKKQKSTKRTENKKPYWIFKPALLFLVMFAVGLLIYAPELRGNFIFDDGFYVQHNHYLKNFSALTHWHQFRQSRPLYWFSFYLGKQIWGNNPAGFKTVNLIFHIFSAYILFFFLLRLLDLKGIYDRWFALAASMLFLVSPLATEAVSYISGRNNGIGGFFFILGCFLYLKTLKSTDRRKKQFIFFSGSILSFITAFLFKEVYIVFVLFYPLLYLWVRPFKKKYLLLGAGTIMTFSIAVLVLSFTVNISPFNRIQSLIKNNSRHFNSKPLATNAYAVAYSMRLFAFPNNLNIDHDLPVLSSLRSPKAIGAIAVILGIGLIFFFLRKKLPLSFPAYISYLLLIAPTNSFILRHGAWMIDPLSERNLYACAIFFSIIAAEILTVFIQKEKNRRVALTLLLVLFASRTFARNMDFQNNIALWQSSLQYSPQRARPNYNLAIALKNANRIHEAIPFARKAVSISPESQCYGLYADLLLKTGQKKKAEETLLDGISSVEKEQGLLLNQLGQIYYSNGQFTKAKQYLEQAIQQNKGMIQARLTLMLIQLDEGNLIAAQKNITDTKRYIRHAARKFRGEQQVTNDSKAMLAFGAGLLKFQSGVPQAGIRFCQKAIKLSPQFTEPMIKLGEYYYKTKQYRKSWKQFLRASRTPGFKRYRSGAAPYMRNLQKLLKNPKLNPGL